MYKAYISVFFIIIAVTSISSQNINLKEYIKDLTKPIGIVNAGDARLFIVEQGGTIEIINNGVKNDKPFLDISNKVSIGSERGLLGLAFHPDYANNGFFYVNYTDQNGNTVIARYLRKPGNLEEAEPNSELVLLHIDQPYENHNGGQLAFGPDGFLYIGLGDGGGSSDPGNRAQSLSQLLGKILRIDVNGNPYNIPANNPFVGNQNARPEIWAFGMRNPWRFSFDRANGDLYVADVGQDEIEEINYQHSGSAGGENYGWRCYEGSHPYNTQNCPAQSEIKFPVFEYSHQQGNCSVTGGFVYRGNKFPSLQGKYVFADFCSGTIWTLSYNGSQWIGQIAAHYEGENFTTFGEDINGELYLASMKNGTIYTVEFGTTNLNNNKTAKIKVYPNPATKMLTLETDENFINYSFSIVDIQGRELYRNTILQNKTSIDLSSFPQGIYLIKIDSGQHAYTYTFTAQ